ncbi:MAG: AAA family ATPase [Gammaproteobacteria bacterium RIFCSPHIGHO2_02_FULL_42_13]|nr:MAG: AAA family ATPase [Gammaproteobacteria bacterium RIFCSPHIGHO2_02_FULL_42_13]OGT70530.1 MAG: AAA family ATPase [Gammaproteobacteria bacterium RIFCSPLOWO2_02_FULL_42_9]
MLFDRVLQLKLTDKKSAFLWGARQTGKSTYLKEKFAESIRYDLLKTDLRLRLENKPYLFREEILANHTKQPYPIIVDEIQKVPALLDEIHWLIENTSAQFLLCGSSARKLKRAGSNLLGGRALRYHFFPLVYPEIPNFNLLTALQNGLVPSHYLAEDVQALFESYVVDYLNEEIMIEGLVRHLPSFSRFLDSMGFSHGQLINYSNIARDCGVSANTVENFYQILVDTLLGYFIPPYHKKVKRDIISKTPKFYLFDVGIANYLTRRSVVELRGAAAGHAFEHFILMELLAYNGLCKKRHDITYWRTKTGLEVDFVLNDAEVAIEVKIDRVVHQQDLKGLIAFCEEHHPKKAFVVSQDERPRILTINDKTTIRILPWKEFLDQLWRHDIV